MKKICIYGRISTQEQNVESQLLAVRKYCSNQDWTIAKEYIDENVSGVKDSRPSLDQLKADCIKGKVKAVVVFKFDRIARSTSHLLECLNLFQRYNVDFVSVTEGVDTSTSVGKMVYTFLGAIAEFERSLIQERVRSGIQRAQASGVHCGRPRKGFDVSEAIQLQSDGFSLRQISKKLNISYSTIYRAVKSVSKTYQSITV
jgi:DNA invertase Pin-like site-specific DNA recombinase